MIEKFYRIQQTLSNLPPTPPRNIFRERLAQLRLLRIAAAFLASGDLPALEDPYGRTIQSSVTDTKLKLWSVGNDGVDDSGFGEWEARKGKDIVLEVER